MEIFSALLAIWAGNSPVSGEFPAQRQVTRSFDVFFDLRPNKRLSKHSWGWWFETLPHPLWRQSNVVNYVINVSMDMSGTVSGWRNQMEAFSALLVFVRGVHWSPANSPHKGQWRGVFMLSMIYAWTHSWVSNRGAIGLRRHRAQHDVPVIFTETRISGDVIICVMYRHREKIQLYSMCFLRKC